MFSPSDLARVAVVGTSGAGKSTFARKLAANLGAQHIEFDAIYWGPNWTPVPAPDVRREVATQTSATRWVCDGNYSLVRDLVWPRATAVVWLNYSFPTVFGRALKRTIRRCTYREPLFGGNRETFRKSFLSSDSILVWILKTHWRHQREFPREFADSAHSHLRVIELRRDSEAERLLDAAARFGTDHRSSAKPDAASDGSNQQ